MKVLEKRHSSTYYFDEGRTVNVSAWSFELEELEKVRLVLNDFETAVEYTIPKGKKAKVYFEVEVR